MKHLAGILVLLAVNASASFDVFFSTTNFDSQFGPQYNRKVQVTPIFYSNAVGLLDPRVYTTGNAASSYPAGFWFSNMLSGQYTFKAFSPPAETTWKFRIQDGTGTYILTTADIIATPQGTGFPTYADITNFVAAYVAAHGGGGGSASNVFISTVLAGETNLVILTNLPSFKYTFDASKLVGTNKFMLASNVLAVANLATSNKLTTTVASVVTNGTGVTGPLQLFDGSAVLSLNWDARNLVDAGNHVSASWADRILYNDDNSIALNWASRNLKDVSELNSIDWSNRKLLQTDGSTAALDWSSSSGITLSHPLRGDQASYHPGANITFTTNGSFDVTIACSAGGSGVSVAAGTNGITATTNGTIISINHSGIFGVVYADTFYPTNVFWLSEQTFPGIISTANATVSGSVTSTNGYLSVTNTVAANGTLAMGKDYYITSGAATLGIGTFSNIDPDRASVVTLRIRATGTITFTNDNSIAASDFVISRPLTNGNLATVSIEIWPRIYTNMFYVQSK